MMKIGESGAVNDEAGWMNGGLGRNSARETGGPAVGGYQS